MITTESATPKPLHREPPQRIASSDDAAVRLRAWREGDREPFADLNADPEVMRYFPATLSRAESDAMVDRIVDHHERYGYGLWALDVDGRFAGFVGLSTATFEAPFTPAVEIGWRLASWAWGRGAASTSARRVLDAAHTEFGIDEVLSFTSVLNAPSIAVMQRIGMTREPAGNFDHPRVPVESALREHVLYRWSA